MKEGKEIQLCDTQIVVIHTLIIHWTGQCVLQDERCFDFEYEITFLMGQNSRHGDGLGFNSGTEHFCLLSHMTSSMLI